MQHCEVLIRDAQVVDGSGAEARAGSVAIAGGRVLSVDAGRDWHAGEIVDARGMVLAPGFIDTHTHDDSSVIETPAMLPKLTQGVDDRGGRDCGISASPVGDKNPLPDPMKLLGTPAMMQYRTFCRVRACCRSRHARSQRCCAGWPYDPASQPYGQARSCSDNTGSQGDESAA